MNTCAECGMPVGTREYHPYAACLMFKATHDSGVVRHNLAMVQDHAREELEGIRFDLHLVGPPDGITRSAIQRLIAETGGATPTLENEELRELVS